MRSRAAPDPRPLSAAVARCEPGATSVLADWFAEQGVPIPGGAPDARRLIEGLLGAPQIAVETRRRMALDVAGLMAVPRSDDLTTARERLKRGLDEHRAWLAGYVDGERLAQTRHDLYDGGRNISLAEAVLRVGEIRLEVMGPGCHWPGEWISRGAWRAASTDESDLLRLVRYTARALAPPRWSALFYAKGLELVAYKQELAHRLATLVRGAGEGDDVRLYEDDCQRTMRALLASAGELAPSLRRPWLGSTIGWIADRLGHRLEGMAMGSEAERADFQRAAASAALARGESVRAGLHRANADALEGGDPWATLERVVAIDAWPALVTTVVRRWVDEREAGR